MLLRLKGMSVRERAWIVWGVDNLTHAVRGTHFNPFAAKGEGNQPLVMWLTQKTSPRADFQFHELAHPDGHLVILEIFPPRAAPLAFAGARYIRIDSHKTLLSGHPDKEARLWAMLGQKDDWSGEVVPEATLNDLDAEALAAARQRFTEYLIKGEADAGRHPQIRSQAAQWDEATLLDKARLTKQGKVTRSALLLLGKVGRRISLLPLIPRSVGFFEIQKIAPSLLNTLVCRCSWPRTRCIAAFAISPLNTCQMARCFLRHCFVMTPG